METILYITCIRFSIQLILSEAVFLVDRPHREHFALRLAGALGVYFILASGWYALLHQIPGTRAPVLVVFYLGLFLLTMGGIALCFELATMELLFVSTGGYAVEHITYAIGKVVQHAAGLTEDTMGVFLHTLVFRLGIYLLGAGMAYVLLIRRNRDKGDFKPRDSRIVMLALAMLMAAIVLSVF